MYQRTILLKTSTETAKESSEKTCILSYPLPVELFTSRHLFFSSLIPRTRERVFGQNQNIDGLYHDFLWWGGGGRGRIEFASSSFNFTGRAGICLITSGMSFKLQHNCSISKASKYIWVNTLQKLQREANEIYVKMYYYSFNIARILSRALHKILTLSCICK